MVNIKKTKTKDKKLTAADVKNIVSKVYRDVDMDKVNYIIDVRLRNAVAESKMSYDQLREKNKEEQNSLKYYGGRVVEYFKTHPRARKLATYGGIAGGVAAAYYFLSNWPIDTFLLADSDHINSLGDAVNNYTYVEVVPDNKIAFLEQYGRKPEIKFPLEFSLLNPRFANLTGTLLGYSMGKYLGKKDKRMSALGLAFITGTSLYIGTTWMLPYFTDFSRIHDDIFANGALPDTIYDFMDEAKAAFPAKGLFDGRGLVPFLLTMFANLAGLFYSSYMRKVSAENLARRKDG